MKCSTAGHRSGCTKNSGPEKEPGLATMRPLAKSEAPASLASGKALVRWTRASSFRLPRSRPRVRSSVSTWIPLVSNSSSTLGASAAKAAWKVS